MFIRSSTAYVRKGVQEAAVVHEWFGTKKGRVLGLDDKVDDEVDKFR